MKIDELMIGDYITFRDVQNDSFCPKLKVCGLIDDDVYVSNDGDPVLDVVDQDDIAGIPLTTDILEKNGFGYVEKDTLMGITHFYLGEPYYCENMNLHIGGDNNGVFWLNYLRNDIWSIRYVHQLQHALRICGIEKEINVN